MLTLHIVQSKVFSWLMSSFFLGNNVKGTSNIDREYSTGSTSGSPLKRDYFNRKYIFQPLIFRGNSLVFQGVWMGNDFLSKVGDPHMVIPRVCMHKTKLTLVGLLDAALSLFNHHLGAKKNSCFFLRINLNFHHFHHFVSIFSWRLIDLLGFRFSFCSLKEFFGDLEGILWMTGEGRSCRSFSVATAPDQVLFAGQPHTSTLAWGRKFDMGFFLPNCHIYTYIILYLYVLKRKYISKSPLTYYISMVQISQGCVHRTNTMWCICSSKNPQNQLAKIKTSTKYVGFVFLASTVWVVQNWRNAINSIWGEKFWKWGCISIPNWEQDILDNFMFDEFPEKHARHQAKNLYIFLFQCFFWGWKCFFMFHVILIYVDLLNQSVKFSWSR